MGSVLVSICGIDRQCSLCLRLMGAVTGDREIEVARTIALLLAFFHIFPDYIGNGVQ
ncbi:hypothetical protein [Spirulina sp. 06S082]|uniref:hypothetical protein n=1 Tax=Spirulina sp. 06S082 TaxID=3110248 RepID=UPI002B1F1C5D|nr:hypothetical protein [Spirulina sp. 06S082]MEA5467834.1 hypothetical protein [Spirulina sp. 06S082]